MKTRILSSRWSSLTALVLVAGIPAISPAVAAPVASECSMSVTLADWGENPTGDIDVAAGESCQIPVGIRGTVTSSAIAQKPAHGKLKKIDLLTYQYTAKAKFKGSDSFAITATGQGPTKSGTSVITVRATIK